MEALTNIIITVAIIIFALKRMGEVAKKGGELTRIPTPEEMFPEFPAKPEMRRREVFEEEDRPVSSPRQDVSGEGNAASDARKRELAARREGRIREIQRRLDEQRIAAEEHVKAAEERFEETRTDTAHPRVAPRAESLVRRGTRQKPLFPAFGRGTLAQGIVMSEILGPPVSLRDAGRW